MNTVVPEATKAGVKRKFENVDNANGLVSNGLKKLKKNKSSNLDVGSKCFYHTISPDIIKSVIEEICASIDPKDHLQSSANSDVVMSSALPARYNGTQRDNSSTASTVEEICRVLGLKNSEIDYSKAEFQITSYNFFQRYVYPILARENPEATRAKIMKLAAAKWCEFCAKNPHLNKGSPFIETEKREKEIPKPTPLNNTPKRRGRPPGSVNATNEQKTKLTTNGLNRTPAVVPGTVKKFDAVNRNSDQAMHGSHCVQKLIRIVPAVVPSWSAKISTDMLRTEEICFNFGLKDVKIDYTKAAPETFRDYVSFNKFVRPKLVKENPLVPMGKVLMLVAAKWREFLKESPPLEAVGKSDTVEKLKYNGTCDKQPLRDLKTLAHTKKYRHIKEVEYKNKSVAPHASRTNDRKKDERSGRQSDNKNLKSTVSISTGSSALSNRTADVNHSAENQREGGVKIKISENQDRTPHDDSPNDGETQTTTPPDYTRTSFHSFQKLVRPILAEKNFRVPSEKSTTFIDKVEGEKFVCLMNSTCGKRTDFDTKNNERENKSKPTPTRPSNMVPSEKSTTFVDKVEGETFVCQMNSTFGKRTDLYTKNNERENESKPTPTRPSNMVQREFSTQKSLGFDEGKGEGLSATEKRTACSSSTRSAPVNAAFPSSSMLPVKTEPEEEISMSPVKMEPKEEPVDCSKDGDTYSYDEDESDYDTSLPYTRSGFSLVRCTAVGAAVHNKSEQRHAEKQKYFPKDTTNECEKSEHDVSMRRDVASTVNRTNSRLSICTYEKPPRENVDTKQAIVSYSSDDNIMSTTTTTHSSESMIANNNNNNEDEYDVFGRWVAMKIRKLHSPVLKLEAENEISSVLLRKSAKDVGYPVFGARHSATVSAS